MRRISVIGVTALLVATGVLTGTASAASVRPAGFGACPADLATPYPAMTCTTVTVPVDYANPGGKTIPLLVGKIAARNPAKRRGVLLVNPGGPGSGAAAYVGRLTKPDASGATRLPASVLDAYDIIGMDPRGVAHSNPISCVDPSYWDGPQPDPDLRKDDMWRKWRTFADGCGAKSGELLPHLGTVNVAKDMDVVRAHLGEEKISYLGFSYGTYLGPVYGELFPQRVDRMVLDGLVNPDPTAMWYRAALAQAPAFQRRVDEDWLPWVARYDNVFHLGATQAEVKTKWNALLADFRAAPHGKVGANELLGLVAGIMFAESPWPGFTKAWSDYVHTGDDAGLLSWATPNVSAAAEERTAAFNAVICADSWWPHDRTVWIRDVSDAARTSQFAWYNAFASGSACSSWPTPHGSRVSLTGQGLPRILMFNTKGDPSTPYAGALKLHERLPNSILVTEQDSGKHCVFANPLDATNPHAQRIGENYLVNGELPVRDVTIPGHGYPVPTASVTADRPSQLGLPE